MTVVESASWTYLCEVTDLGKNLDLDKVYTAVLMTPPADDLQLCEVPASLQSNQTSRANEWPVALLVSLGGCDVATKVRVAQELQQTVESSLTYVIFYNNNPESPGEIASVSLNTTNGESDASQSLTFAFISTVAGTNLMSRIQIHASHWGGSPVLGAEGNNQWDLPMLLRAPTDTSNLPSRITNKTANFEWFRVVLFSLLIVSPCCRACFLWYGGGGRIRFRRNEAGRIVGLEHILPADYNLPPGVSSTPKRLTQEDVLGLPEIIYRVPEDEELATDTPDERTSCTACSICIEDFESGERVRILPRCRHGFHTDCVLPWLTERQGCCPLCKTVVLPESDEEGEEACATQTEGVVQDASNATTTTGDGMSATAPTLSPQATEPSMVEASATTTTR
eukprot:Nitzschia sp. Nitz4//scaffold119_size111653//28316//29500//NITZ4_004183-RA/size111653-processed-gene-0.30-mRNA-1//-1//CDS//3329533815//3196//frame0